MAAVTFDTLKFVERLKAAGVPEEQAKALAEAQRDVFVEALDSQLAAKAEIVKLERRFDAMDAQFVLHKWMLGATFAGVATVLVWLFFYFPNV
jgi:hypothetical protein